MFNLKDYILEKLHIGKDSKFKEALNCNEVISIIRDILESYKIDEEDINIHFGKYPKVTLDIINYIYYYDKGLVPSLIKLFPELIRKLEAAGLEFSKKPNFTNNATFYFYINNLKNEELK